MRVQKVHSKSGSLPSQKVFCALGNQIPELVRDRATTTFVQHRIVCQVGRVIGERGARILDIEQRQRHRPCTILENLARVRQGRMRRADDGRGARGAR
jgi:hypothetical protein